MPLPRKLPASLPACGGPGPLENLRLGFLVLAGELAWAFASALRRLELRQLRGRLDEQHRLLGELTSAGPAAEPDRLKAQAQAEFLLQDMALLDGQLQKARRDFLARRAAGRRLPWL